MRPANARWWPSSARCLFRPRPQQDRGEASSRLARRREIAQFAPLIEQSKPRLVDVARVSWHVCARNGAAWYQELFVSAHRTRVASRRNSSVGSSRDEANKLQPLNIIRLNSIRCTSEQNQLLSTSAVKVRALHQITSIIRGLASAPLPRCCCRRRRRRQHGWHTTNMQAHYAIHKYDCEQVKKLMRSASASILVVARLRV